MRHKERLVIAIFIVSLLLFLGIQDVSACPGRIFNPITDVDWRGVFPIKISGVMVASFEQEDTELGENGKTHRLKIPVQCESRTNGQTLHHRKGGTVHKRQFEIRIGLKQQKRDRHLK